MKTGTRFYIVLFMGLISSSLSAQTDAQLKNEIARIESGLLPAVRFEGESAWKLEDRMKFYNIPAVSIAVIRNYQVIWTKAYGLADVENKTPATTATLFQVASMSKPVTAYAALKEVEEGKIDPDADVNRYLKSWKIPENEWTKQKPVTLKNILSHTAGFTVHGFPGYEAGKPLPTVIQVLNGEKPANTDAVKVDKLPGKSFRYSGGGYTVLQEILTDIEGKDFATLMKEKILMPLGMKNSSFTQPLPESQSVIAATAYLENGTKVQGRYHIYPEQAAAGLWSTAEDYARFVVDIQNTLNGKSNTIISKKMAEAFTTPYIETFEGLGVMLETYGNQVYFSHGGWNEGFSSLFTASKTSGDGIVVLTNTNKPQFINEVIRSVATEYQWPEFMAPTLKILPLKQEDFSNADRYKFNKYGVYRVYQEKGKLMMKMNMETPIELLKIGENNYALRNWNFKISFRTNPKTGKRELMETLLNKTIRSENPQWAKDEKGPLELISEGYFEKGLEAYKKAKKEDADNEMLSEDYINSLGYTLLREKKYTNAIDFFRVNTQLYPQSANTYDSLGEAYLEAGQKDKALENYRKVLKINPENENAIKILKTTK
ncbi:beta-lactamase family protein [Chryseobacterium sp. B21-037]|uniref:beta-lactamase family protein n=1 Tax=Chryseobacterium sp. B21-037 TaxID=2926038 RepID=UPI002359A9BB|nr:beta-lactamase family protein [Chryseobacterium sp. B21-037]MDC8103424.1 beta-lactamase family protein [Chryseobacterium sp. B21-037]